MNRRGFLSGLLAACTAPAIVRASSLMPGRGLIVPSRLAFHPDSFVMSMPEILVAWRANSSIVISRLEWRNL